MKNLLGKKKGMTQIFDEAGKQIPVTIIEAGPCVITQVKSLEKDGYAAVQVGFGAKKEKKINKPLKGHLKNAKCAYLREFRVGKEEEHAVGQEIKADVFKPGEKISISANSIGKGFAGTVKKWHFRRGPMTHGSKSHRIPGSIGAGTTPGRVYKGRKMPGRLGGGQVTLKNVKIVQVQPEKNLLLVKGAVPGAGDNLLIIKGQEK